MSNLKLKLEELGPLMKKQLQERNKFSDEIRMIESFFTKKNFYSYVEMAVPINFEKEDSRADFILSWRKYGKIGKSFRLIYISPDKEIEKPLIETDLQTRKAVYPYLPYFLDAVKTELTKGEKDEQKI